MKIKIEIVARDEDVEEIVSTVERHAHTGEQGDGKSLYCRWKTRCAFGRKNAATTRFRRRDGKDGWQDVGSTDRTAEAIGLLPAETSVKEERGGEEPDDPAIEFRSLNPPQAVALGGDTALICPVTRQSLQRGGLLYLCRGMQHSL